MASLKPLQQAYYGMLGAIPRPRGRGLIEAESHGPRYRAGNVIPRPRGRGLIEALKSFLDWQRISTQFHDRAVVASLKRVNAVHAARA